MKVLINGTVQETFESTQNTVEIMKQNGGFILSPSHDFLLLETPVENVLAMYDTGVEVGEYE